MRLAVLASSSLQQLPKVISAAREVVRQEQFDVCYPLLTDSRTRILLAPIIDHYSVEWIEFNHDLHPLAQAAPPTDHSHSRHLLLAREGTAHAKIAEVYAALTGKRYLIVQQWDQALHRLSDQPLDSILLTDTAQTFSKPFLDWMLAHPAVQHARHGAGLFTARNEAALSSLGLRMLLVQLGAPAKAQSFLQPYRVLAEHGNEMHMHLHGGQVLCGAAQLEGAHAGEPRESSTFNCVPTCPHPNRVAAHSLATHSLLISSCNTFTLQDGLVPPEFSILMNLLDGWCSSVLAPFKHAMTGPAVPVLIDAMGSSGETLGSIMQRLNGLATLGAASDAAYLLLGDPLTAVAAAPPTSPSCETTETGQGVAVQPCAARRFHDVPLPLGLTEDAIQHAHKLGLAGPATAETQADVYFAFCRRHGQEWRLLLFSAADIPPGPPGFVIAPNTRDFRTQNKRVRAAVQQLSHLAAMGVGLHTINIAQEMVLTPMRFAMGYPRVTELVAGEELLTGLDSLLDENLSRARLMVLDSLLELTADRLWLSQNYGRFYTSVERKLDVGVCAYCGCAISRWDYEDACCDRVARTVMICSRCGIVADHPAATELMVRMDTIARLPLGGLTLPITITNTSASTVRFSLAMQFHEWRNLGIRCDFDPRSLSLGPGQRFACSAEFVFAKPFPDYMQDIHLFVMLDDFALSCYTQKLVSKHRSQLQANYLALIT